MAAKTRQAPTSDKTSGTRKGAQEFPSKVQELADAGCLTPELLSPSVLQAIQGLSAEDIQALKRVNRVVSLSTFFKARGPQQGG